MVLHSSPTEIYLSPANLLSDIVSKFFEISCDFIPFLNVLFCHILSRDRIVTIRTYLFVPNYTKQPWINLKIVKSSQSSKINILRIVNNLIATSLEYIHPDSAKLPNRIQYGKNQQYPNGSELSNLGLSVTCFKYRQE